MNLSPFYCTLSLDWKTATMRRGLWKMQCPAQNLPAWLRFYRKLAEKRRGNAEIYGPCIIAIEAAIKRLQNHTEEAAKEVL